MMGRWPEIVGGLLALDPAMIFGAVLGLTFGLILPAVILGWAPWRRYQMPRWDVLAGGRLFAAALPDLLMVAGVGLALAGVYLLLGLAVALIVGGVLVAGYGAALDVLPKLRRRER